MNPPATTAPDPYDRASSVFDPIPASAAGRRLFAIFEGVDGEDQFQRVDNVRLEVWPDPLQEGAFLDKWDGTPGKGWLGPGYWANCSQDWKAGEGQCRRA